MCHVSIHVSPVNPYVPPGCHRHNSLCSLYLHFRHSVTWLQLDWCVYKSLDPSSSSLLMSIHLYIVTLEICFKCFTFSTNMSEFLLRSPYLFVKISEEYKWQSSVQHLYWLAGFESVSVVCPHPSPSESVITDTRRHEYDNLVTAATH